MQGLASSPGWWGFGSRALAAMGHFFQSPYLFESRIAPGRRSHMGHFHMGHSHKACALPQRPLVLSEICTTVDCEPILISTEIGKAPAGTAVVISDWVLAS